MNLEKRKLYNFKLKIEGIEMSKYVNKLLKFYNEQKDIKPAKPYIKSLKKLLEFYGVKPD